MRLACQDISYSYPLTDKPVLEHLSFSINSPGFNSFFGPSGVGKTSLARIIIGHISGYAGEVRKEGVGRILYTYNLERLPGWSKVRNHLAKITPPGRQRQKDDLVASFGVDPCLSQRFSELSLGQKNRINLIRYLLQDFGVLIMDESLANVDERTRERIIVKVKRTFPESVFFYISHNVVEVSKFCRRIFVLRNAAKQPQALEIEGRDYSGDVLPSRAALEQTMLEVMNAS